MSNCGTISPISVNDCPRNGFKQIERLNFFNGTKADGTEYEFATLSALTSSAITTAINETDKLNRFYPVINADNEEAETTENKTTEGTSGIIYFNSEGVRKVMVHIMNGDLHTANGLNGLRNFTDLRCFAIDINGALQYKTDSTRQKVQGMEVDASTISARHMPAQGDNIEYVELTFMFKRSEDKDLIMVATRDDLGFNPADYFKQNRAFSN